MFMFVFVFMFVFAFVFVFVLWHLTLRHFQSIEYEDVHDKASKGVQGEGAVKFSIHIEDDE